MARRGRKPTPTHLKTLRGTRKDRVNQHEPKVESACPAEPKHLDTIGRAEWRRIVPLLDRMGVLASVDGAALALYCDTYSRWYAARQEVDKRGLLVEVDMEYGTVLKLNPASAVMTSTTKTMIQLLTEFGCTPSSRSRVSVKDSRKDPLEAFLLKKA